VNDPTFVRSILVMQYWNKKLSYHRGTARRAVLANSCYVSQGMGVRKANVTFKVIKGHRQWCHSIDHKASTWYILPAWNIWRLSRQPFRRYDWGRQN